MLPALQTEHAARPHSTHSRAPRPHAPPTARAAGTSHALCAPVTCALRAEQVFERRVVGTGNASGVKSIGFGVAEAEASNDATTIIMVLPACRI